MLETEFTAIDVCCRTCGARWEAPVARTVNAGTHPDARLGIILGRMHRARCPVCATMHDLDVIVDYYDPDQARVIQVRPAWERRAGGEEWYWDRLEDLVGRYWNVAVWVEVVFGFTELTEQYLGGPHAVAAAHREWEARNE